MEMEIGGKCPYCGGNDGFLNVGRTHWFVCHKCGVRWWLGCDLYPTWKSETEEDWSRNAKLLQGYKQVEPQIKGRSFQKIARVALQSQRG